MKTQTQPIAKLAQTKNDIFSLDPRDIVVIEGLNPRLDFAGHDELVESIRVNGILTPVLGYKEKGIFYLKDGERRHRAAMQLINEGAPIRVPFQTGKKGSIEDILVEMFARNDGKPFTKIEEANLVGRLLKCGLTSAEVAKRLGRSISQISDCTILSGLPTRAKNKIVSGEISASVALSKIRENGVDNIDAAADEILELVKASGGEKVTAKTARQSAGKVNSFSILKKTIGKLTVDDVTNTELFDIFTKIVAGEATEEYFANLLGA